MLDMGVLTKGGHRIHCLQWSVLSNCSVCSLCNLLAVACGGFHSPVSVCLPWDQWVLYSLVNLQDYGPGELMCSSSFLAF